MELIQNNELVGESQTTRLLSFLKDFHPFLDENGDVLLEFSIEGKRQVWRINDQIIIECVQGKYFDAFNSLPEEKNIEKILKILAFTAKKSSERTKVFHRVANEGSAWFIDLGSKTFDAISITNGKWDISESFPVKFVRNKNTLSLPVPSVNGDINVLRKYLNLCGEEDFILILAFCIGSLRASREYPILIIQGGQGSSKSTTAKLLKELIDPGRPVLRSFSKREEDMFIAAKNSHLVCYDNLSGISNAGSDSLCKIATGCGLTARKLYTDSDESCIELSRPIVINGIDELASRADLADRSIVIHLPKISEEKRQTSTAYWSAFEEDKSSIFGALLDALAYGQERRKTLHLAKVPRMAEFAVTVCASLEYFGYRPEQTLSVLLTNRAEIAMEAIESNSVGRALKAFMANKQMWRGTATKLLSLLGQFVPDEERRSIYWPKVANILGKEINRLAPSLKLEGIEASSHRVGKSREIVLIRDSFNPDVLSHPSLSSLGIFGSTRATEVTSVTTVTTVSESGDL